MNKHLKELDVAITVCDTEGHIIEMNAKSLKTFEKYGGTELIGRSLFDCHPPHASAKIRELFQTHETNAYTIEKAGQKKLIYQTPWFENGEYKGYVELSLVLPEVMEHKIRK